MHVESIPFAATGSFSALVTDYISRNPQLRHFYKYEPDLASFERVIEEMQQQQIDRTLLADVLEEQYVGLDSGALVKKNIALLRKENTFTVCTAHQPVIGTGPLYFVIKILCTINLAERLAEVYPDYHFVPVYWLGGEDHDFEEISSLHLFGKTVTWQRQPAGAVGRMDTSGMEAVLDELDGILGGQPAAQEWMGILTRAYLDQPTLGLATRQLMHEIFGVYGLVIFGGDHPELKRSFLPVLEAELREQMSHRLVQPQVEALEKLGYHGQAHVRHINLFYLKDGLRERIEVDSKGKYTVVGTGIHWTADSLDAELQAHPERFSPNVILRPLYQEWLLPNLAYVGGGGELAYWLQYKKLFEHFRTNFPVLVLRNSVMWLDRGASKKRKQLGLSYTDLFRDVEDLIKDYVASNTAHDISLHGEKESIRKAMDSMAAKAAAIDPTLERTALAEGQKLINGLEKLEAKLLKAEKQQHDQAVGQIRWLKDKLFPEGHLQERHENIAAFYLKYGPATFTTLKEALRPFEHEFVVVEDV